MAAKYLAIFGSVIALSSCSNDTFEWSKFEAIQVEASGIELTQPNEFNLEGTVPASGSTFTITGTGKLADYAYATQAFVDGNEIEADTKNDKPAFNGDWGSVWSNPSQHVINFQISENNSGEPRTFEITIGFGYTHTNLKIIQEPIL